MTLQKRATLIASLSAAFLAISKLIVGIASNSVAILASAIDSILDLAISLFNYLALQHSEKGADETFNYGRGKAEALASVVEGVIIILSGFLIVYEAIWKLREREEVVFLLPSVILMGISLLVTSILVIFLLHVARKTDNMIIKADALHYKSDLLSNGAVLLSLLCVMWFDFHALDSLLGIAMGVYLAYCALSLVREGIAILLDKAMPRALVEKIIHAIRSHKSVQAFHDLKTREAGDDRFVEVHLVFERGITLLSAHEVSDEVEAAIRALDSRKRWNLTIHLDPYDDSVKKD